jgi:DNA-binding Lrp family transcriptional regulator
MPKISREQNDEDETRIVDELLKNPSLDAAQIAEKSGISKRKVWKVLSQLEENGTILARSVIIDPSKLGKRSYIVLCERSSKHADDRFLELILSEIFVDELRKQGIKATIQDGYYLSGPYDWAFVVVVDEQRDFTRLFELFKKWYEGYFSKIVVTEILFTRSRNGVINPHPEELKELLQ